MALKLTKGKPKARAVPLEGGVTLWVRPATYPESIEASEHITPMIAGLREGSDAASTMAVLLGDEFVGAVYDEAQLAAAASKLALMELVVLCTDRVEGDLRGDDDMPIAEIDLGIAALLIRDLTIARRLRDVLEGPLFEVIAEKNGSAASPNGAAATPDTAPNAETPAPVAH